MKKRFTLLTAGILCVASIGAGVIASNVIQEIKAELRPDFTIKIDGDIKTFKNANGDTVYPILYNGTTYLPIRAIGELMNKTVYWYEDEKLVELKTPEVTTVTDADVIVDSSKQPQDKNKDNKKEKQDKNNGSQNSFISKEDAIEIALNKANLSESDGVIKKPKLDEDDNQWVYEVEFYHNFTEYEAEISATEGTVISWDVDND